MPKAVLIWKYKGSSKPLSLSPSKDAERIAVCFSNSEIHMLDKNGKLSWKIDSNSSGITNVSDIAHASQQNMTLVGSKDKKLHLLDSEGSEIWIRSLPNPVTSVSISSRANLSIAGTTDGTMFAFDRTGKLLWDHQVGGTSFPVNSVSTSPNGSYVISGSRYRYSYFYDSKGNVLWDKDVGGSVLDTSINKNGDYLCLLSDQRHIQLLVKNARLLWEYTFDNQPAWVSLPDHSEFTAVGGTTLSIFNKAGKRAWKTKLPGSSTFGTLSGDGGSLFTISDSGLIQHYDISSYLKSYYLRARRKIKVASSEGLDVSAANQFKFSAKKAFENREFGAFIKDIKKILEVVNEARYKAPVSPKSGASNSSSDRLICGKCQSPNPSDYDFCQSCGSKLSNTCSNCHKQLSSGMKFCTNCGKKV